MIFLVSSCETTPSGGSGSASAAAGSPHAAGKRIYLTRCTSCHSPEPVGDYTRSEWRSMVDHMRKRAKLQPDEEKALLAYLMANAFDA
jgi:mono/diheme cytochrome c family protein